MFTFDRKSLKIVIKAISLNPIPTEIQIGNRNKPKRSENGQSAGAAVREDFELPGLKGSDQVKGCLTQMVQDDRQLEGHQSILFEASE